MSPICHFCQHFSGSTSIPGITIKLPDYDDMEYSGDFPNEGSGLTDDEDL